MRELFIDCSAGLAGDMLSAALLELCPDRENMLKRLNSFGIPGIEYSAGTVKSYSVAGTHLTVRYLGKEEGANSPDEYHHGGHINDIFAVIDGLGMQDKVRENVKGIYRLLADAESKVHGCNVENIHFHELGTMDAVADISAACFLIAELGAEHITASPVRTGYGTVECAHGVMPVPAPATALLLKGLPSFAGDVEGELCTPTGAAIVKYFADTFGQAPLMTTEAVGYGIGSKDFGRLSCVRASLGKTDI